MLSHVGLCVTLWTVAHQAPLSMGFSRQEYWNALPFHPPGALPHPEIEPESPVSASLQADSLPTEQLGVLMVPFSLVPPLSIGLWARERPPECCLGRQSGSGSLPHLTPAGGVLPRETLLGLPALEQAAAA